MSGGPLLVVEDSDEDFEVLTWVLHKLGRTERLERCLDGDAVLDYLHGRGVYASRPPRPRLIFLDLNLPGTDGREVLAELQASEALRSIPVIALTTSLNPRDVQGCYALGVNAYLTKPVDLERFVQSLRITLEFWLDTTVLPDALEPL